jgi:hypothetical protein
MQAFVSKGFVYRCPVCGSEVLVVARRMGVFEPQCCNRGMIRLNQKVAFYACPVCGAELSVLYPGDGAFLPECCNTPMRLEAA